MATLQEDAEKFHKAVLNLGRVIAEEWRLTAIVARLNRQIRRWPWLVRRLG